MNDPAYTQRRKRGRGRGGRGGRGRGRGPMNWAAGQAGTAPSGSEAIHAKFQEMLHVPAEEAIDASLTLKDLRSHEGTILSATRLHEDALVKLQNLYKKVRAKMYRDHKTEVIAEDNSKLQQFQAGCPKPKELGTHPSKEELDRQAQCLQREASEQDDSDLGLLMRRHLKVPIPPQPTGATCAPFRQVDFSQLSPKTKACLGKVGDARWTSEGLIDAPQDALGGAGGADSAGRRLAGASDTAAAAASTTTASSASTCGRRWLGTADARCLLANKNLVFFGNSVVRRQMYTILDLLAGPAAHRQLNNFTDVKLPGFKDEGSIARSWIWDQDNMTRGYHASQLFTVDLHTGEHRFEMPHASLCGMAQSHSVFSPGRMHQWREPGQGGGTEELTGAWRNTKWAAREWQPLVSFHLALEDEISPRRARAAAAAAAVAGDACAPRTLSWAGSHPAGMRYVPPATVAGAATNADLTSAGGRRRRVKGPERGLALAARLRSRLLRELESYFGSAAAKARGGPDVREWLGNVSVHYDEDLPGWRGTSPARVGRRGGAEPNVWIYFPTYHGERERFNGFCEDKQCECTSPPVKAECTTRRHPECSHPPRHMCKPMAPGSAAFVDMARAFAAALVSKGRLLGHPISAVKLTPFYDDCWANRGRCQGARPCREPVDQAWTCRATAMLCVGRTWPDALRQAKAWIPAGHPSMSMLYLYDGQTSELLDETMRTWGPQSVGYASDALIFGPQFGSFHGAAKWKRTLGGMRMALRPADACLGRRTLLLFRSPAFNFDPVNTPRQ